MLGEDIQINGAACVCARNTSRNTEFQEFCFHAPNLYKRGAILRLDFDFTAPVRPSHFFVTRYGRAHNAALFHFYV